LGRRRCSSGRLCHHVKSRASCFILFVLSFWKSSGCFEFSVVKWLALLVSWKLEFWRGAYHDATGHGGTYEPARLLPPSTTQRGEHWSHGTITCHYSPGVKPIVEHGATFYARSFDEDCTSTTPADFVPYLPPSPSQRGDGSDGTHTCHNSTGVKPIAGQGASSYACSLNADCLSTTKAVFVFPLSSNSTKGGSKPGRASSCHRPPVLETAHLALPLVQPAGSIKAEAPPSPSTVPWRVDLCQLGSGQSSSTPSPDR